ncbi:hypothetical protein BgiBS90_029726, partial [Biomphalaria glabrata]
MDSLDSLGHMKTNERKTCSGLLLTGTMVPVVDRCERRLFQWWTGVKEDCSSGGQ